MALWIEFRCDNRGTNPDCLSNSNAGPMGLSGNTVSDVATLLTDLRRDGKATGWKVGRGDLLCPVCAVVLAS